MELVYDRSYFRCCFIFAAEETEDSAANVDGEFDMFPLEAKPLVPFRCTVYCFCDAVDVV